LTKFSKILLKGVNANRGVRVIMEKNTVLYIARLSRLELNNEEQDEITNDFMKIIGFVEKISELDVKDEVSYITVNSNVNVFRDDVSERSSIEKDIKYNAPEYRDGFFIVREGDKLLYTRAGNFGIDRDGFLVNPSNGMRVQGWMGKLDRNTGEHRIDAAGEIGDIKLPIYGKEPAKATSEVVFKSNLNSATLPMPPNPDEKAIRKLSHRTSMW
jgi:aspartyl/glutamyl-tRNA(Asn/Gln) amidotransferase C subunit